MDARGIQEALRKIGWPITVDGDIGPLTRQAVHDFQAGLAFRNLAVDGDPGPATQHELAVCLDRGGRCGQYFRFAEFRSKGNKWIKVSRVLVHRLDRYRKRFGPTSIISGYRDPAHNKKIGGVPNSQHLFGKAADVEPVATVAQVRALRLFTGIGFNGSTGRVAHVDVRPGDPEAPTTWKYGR